MKAMMTSVNATGNVADAAPSRDTGKSMSQGGEFESILSSIEEQVQEANTDSERGIHDDRNRLEANDAQRNTSPEEVTSTEESAESTEEVSEVDLYNTLIELTQNLIEQVRLQSMKSEVGTMQENLEEKLKKLNELVSTMKSKTNGEPFFDSSVKGRPNDEPFFDSSVKSKTNGEPFFDSSVKGRPNDEPFFDSSVKSRLNSEHLFDSSAFNTDEASRNEDQRAVLQQVLKEAAPLSNFTEVDKKQLSDLTAILNRELGVKNEAPKSTTESQREALLEKVQALFDSENVVVETKKPQANLSNQLRVDQLFHSLKSNVEPDVIYSTEKPRAASAADLLAGHLSPEKLESAKSKLENILGSVQAGPSVQTSTSNVGVNSGIDSKQNRVMTTQILPRIETALKAGESNFKMILSPHGLGQVEVKLLHEDGKLKVQLAAFSSATTELLAAQIDELKKALGTKDIQVMNSGHNKDFADDSNPEFSNEFFKNNEGRKEREEDSSRNSEKRNKVSNDVAERVEAKLVNPKPREGNLLGRI